ncbi:histone-lysine N-methyltransferase, H3 lysine-9 specific SUVH1-like [Ananas comosus]|uniref:Histone-lysine N-methyltransferase, H3 lysine-9 specific SUVH1-like n=1 Tax=Ananas comosus TaxID=4615 RepID=A0A6P5G0J3_ANACO|nr:histone-lysine N-methyltransferase, H3 lysine-9 specific SUVH1-like [Ananas comosus]XP_020101874.1 histone-lysine N-methyltransferase, H3 lysine-9 specific SUVH1-like [Ananas comosus]
MERNSNFSPSSSQEGLDAKPLRSLTPMFPAPFGFNAYTQSATPPFVCVSPFAQFPGNPSFQPLAAGVLNSNGVTFAGVSDSNGPINATPISAAYRANVHSLDDEDEEEEEEEEEDEPVFTRKSSKSGRKIKRSHLGGSDGLDGTKIKRVKPVRKIFDKSLLLLPSSSNHPRETVEMVLSTFDALRRRLLQLDELEDINRRPDLRAGAIMMTNEFRANMGKRIGSIPGVEIGDIFYFRIEMCVVGLHAPSMAGIDYMTARFDHQEEPVAVCIVSSGGYENADDDVDVLVYSGQGGNNRYEEKHDQKLERGNLALEKSTYRKNEIRVVRSAKDPNCQTGKIYIYDGLYKIQDAWKEKSKSGFNVFKYKLLREPGQRDGIAVWKMTQKWIENPSLRGRVILPDLSSGIENIPVCLVNEVDHEKGPSHFTYVTKVRYSKPISSMKPSQGCRCLSVCLPGDRNCSCAQVNGGDLPYSSLGLIASRRNMIYECSDSCQCSYNCRNRVTQKGIRLHFEVFRTRNRGWGLRSWDPIRAGSFICEYTGEVIDESKVDLDDDDDDYLFQTACPGEKTLRWNYGAELAEEPSGTFSTDTYNPLPIMVSARNMGNVARFMNHSCSPNVFWQPVQHDHSDDGHPHIMFFAMKHIPPMTELTYDYGVSGKERGSGGVSRRAKRCLCGSPACRGSFG